MRTVTFFLLLALLGLAPCVFGGGGNSLKLTTGPQTTGTEAFTTGWDTTGQDTTGIATTGAGTTAQATTGFATTGCSVVCGAAYNVCVVDIRTGASAFETITPTLNPTTCSCDPIVTSSVACTSGTSCNPVSGCVVIAPPQITPIEDTMSAASSFYVPPSLLLLVSTAFLIAARAALLSL